MKIVKILLILMSFSSTLSKRSCKTDLLRSFKLHGRLVPDKSNILCPSIDWNCCTVQDQMKIHKQWQTHIKADLTNHYEIQKNDFETFLSSFVLAKDIVDMTSIISAFSKTTPTPSQKLIDHLSEIEKEYKKLTVTALRTITVTVKSTQKKLFKKVLEWRSALPCTICNYKNHAAISPETMTVTLKNKFCKDIKVKYAQLFFDKYFSLMKHVLLLDEFVYLISNYKLLRYDADKGILHKYKAITKDCLAGQCDALCGEYNLNKFSYMFDGDSLLTNDFLKRYQKISDYLLDNNKYSKLFAMKNQAFNYQPFSEIEKYTVLKDNYKPMKPLKPWDKNYKKYNRNGLVDFGDRSKMPRKYIERIHPSSSIMLETLDDQISSFTIFRIIEKPVDISTFITKVESQTTSNYGVNPQKDAKGLNLDQGVETLLAMLNNKKSDALSLNEIIEDDVKKMLDRNSMKQISFFYGDHSLHFKKIVVTKKLTDFKSRKLQQEQSEKLQEKEERKLFGWSQSNAMILLTTIIAFVI